jgi:hypothetical protein
MTGRFVTDGAVSEFSRKANDYARRFNKIAEQHGIDLPMEVIIPLVELFGEAMSAGIAPSAAPSQEPWK